MEQIELLANKAIQQKIFPGVVIGVINNSQPHTILRGSLTYEQTSPKVSPSTIYDLASITKVIPTATLILKLIEQGKLTEETKVINYIPELKTKYREQIKIKHLLTYTVLFNLPRLSQVAKQGGDVLLETCLNAELAFAPGEKLFYSNFPLTLLAMIAERITGEEFTTLANKTFFEPLKMTGSSFKPKTLHNAQIAPTEIDERGTVLGEVHDEAAWALDKANLTVGHAGLFSNVNDLLNFSQMLINDGRFEDQQILSKQTIEKMYTNQLNNIGEKFGLGWAINGGPFEFMGSEVSQQAFGMTGFTGTSILIDPVKKRALVILSNATFPKRRDDKETMHSFRRAVADIVFA